MTDRNNSSKFFSNCLGVGGAFVDIICHVSYDFLAKQNIKKGSRVDVSQEYINETLKSLHMHNPMHYTGGSAANTIYNMRMLGETTSFVGSVSKDQFGDFFVDTFFNKAAIPAFWDNEHPVCFKHISSPNLGTSVCMVFLTPDGERTMAVATGSSKKISVEDLKKPMEQTAGVFTESYELVYCEDSGLIPYILNRAEDLGLYTAIGLSDLKLVTEHRNCVNNYINSPSVKLVFGTQEEFMALSETRNDSELLNHATKRCLVNGKTMIITRAEKGAWIVDTTGTKHEIPVVPVSKVVDSTGAGDGFAAGYLFGYVRRPDRPELCGKIGSLIASTIVQRIGSTLLPMSTPETSELLSKINRVILEN